MNRYTLPTNWLSSSELYLVEAKTFSNPSLSRISTCRNRKFENIACMSQKAINNFMTRLNT